MSDNFLNENENQTYNSFGAPHVPPQAPTVQTGYNPAQAPQPSAPSNSQFTSAPVPPACAPSQPPCPPQAPARPAPPYTQSSFDAGPYQYPNVPPTPPYYNSPYTPSSPPKQPMGAGLKALLIIVITFLFVSLIAFIAYVSMSDAKSNSGFVPAEESTTPTLSEYPFGSFDFDDDTESTQPTSGDYEKSDAKDKTDAKFKGITLNKKSAKNSGSGAAYAFKSIEKSVVSIIGYVDGQGGNAQSYSVMGTGIIVTSDGYIVTNAHLLNYSRTAYLYKVIAYNTEYEAGVVGYDSRSDLAVLKIDAKNLTPAVFGDSSEVEITEDVIVVGNPLSLKYQNSVTKGIVSAVDRQTSTTNNVKYIQTDAAVNPGNSGGPLCNMYGQVIGITNSKIALDDYEGMGFAIPSKLVKSVVDDIIKYSYVTNRVKIGVIGKVKYINETYGTGIEIQEITNGGPMDGTGAQAGDFVVKFDGKKVLNFAEIYDALETHKAGDKVKVTVYRPSDNKEYDLTVKLEADEY